MSKGKNVFILIFNILLLIYPNNTQVDGNDICELGDSCLGFEPDCSTDCANDVTNVDDPSTLLCLESLFDGMSDINACCIPSIKGRPINGTVPPNCLNVTAPFGESSRV